MDVSPAARWRSGEPGTLAGVFGFGMIIFGSLIGSGFALSSEPAKAQ